MDDVALPAQAAPRRSPFVDRAALPVDDELPEFVWRSVGGLALGLVVQLQFRRLETTRVQCSHVGEAGAGAGEEGEGEGDGAQLWTYAVGDVFLSARQGKALPPPVPPASNVAAFD